jgi:phosphoglycolate phosphatase-like HAD superfamily hydrolase
VIIGDTPHDVDCALTNGCTAIGVGTGGWSPTELKSAGAHATVEALTDVDRSLRVLGLS